MGLRCENASNRTPLQNVPKPMISLRKTVSRWGHDPRRSCSPEGSRNCKEIKTLSWVERWGHCSAPFHTQSSMPTTLSGSEGDRLRRLTTRNSVSLLTGSISCFANIAAALPPSARPRWWTMPSSLVVRRADGARTPSAKRSVKIAVRTERPRSGNGERLSRARPSALTREGP